jgi:DNA-binding XRE family transcriptional regulator
METTMSDMSLFEELTDAQRTPEEQAAHRRGVAEAKARLNIAMEVYRMRTEAGISQTELARRLGISQPAISAIERGAKTPTVPTLERIAEATDHEMRILSSQAT